MFKFVTWFITHKYETSNIMGMDAVFVHMVKKYYTKEKAYWLDDAGLYKIQDRAKQLEPILVGKKCRNLVLQDTSGVYQSMYDIKAPYTILFFWDPDCGHCQKAVPKVKEFYEKMHSQGIEIYGVCTETESEKWRKFIAEKQLPWINVGDPNFKDNFRWDFDLSTTPQFFILDKNKIIIGKRLDVDQFEDFINHDKKKATEKM
jgi:peroxiredoxin